MSTYSEAWHDTPPAIRDFYRNYHRRHVAHVWKTTHWPGTLRWIPYTFPGGTYSSADAPHIAYANWEAQTLDFGSFNPAIVYLADPPVYPPPPIQPHGPPFPHPGYPDQFLVVPVDAWEYPRDSYRVRRQYWTGKPRRRQNL